MPKLTKQVVAGLKAAPDPRAPATVWTWDTELRGFGVGVGRKGTKSFVVQYRNEQGKTRRKVIGRFGLMTAEEARRIARSMLGDVARGQDPVEAANEEGRHSINAICDWYLERAGDGKIIGRSRKPIKASTLAMDRSRIEAHIRPLLGHRIIETLKLGDIEAAQADIAAGVTSKPRAGSRGGATKGGDGVAARTMSTLHSVLEHAVRLGEIEKNPARGVRRLASTPRMRWLSQAELRKLGAALREAEAELEHPKGIAVIRLLLLTGFRRLEALGIEWKWLLDEEHAIHFATTKTGAQRRVIGAAAVSLLKKQHSWGPNTSSRPIGAMAISLVLSACLTACAQRLASKMSPPTCCGTPLPVWRAGWAIPNSRLPRCLGTRHAASPSDTSISTSRYGRRRPLFPIISCSC